MAKYHVFFMSHKCEFRMGIPVTGIPQPEKIRS